MEKIISSERHSHSLAQHNVLRNTYFLLALTLTFSALTACASTLLHLPAPGFILTLVGFYGLMYLTHRLADRPVGILAAFAFTGFLGYCLGPILSRYLSVGMGETIAFALAGTAVVFFCCSAYVLTTRRDMSFLNGILITGFVVLLVAVIANIFLKLPALQMTISVLFILFSSAAILWETSNIVQGGETNYIRATVSLYVSLYNIFVSLLSLLGLASRND
ncbi:FtsH protease modulator YccA [Rosenbergiella australiborealis]|uniref:FtsH protease modulator YccA n=1 Tax=Rosenbergiella australiborealis TaxID=1544696 RepID=A0ABS5T5W4_9GAMM|nr:FtsH protease modulator YccA [Rosenbergiella australiborealis]MBT0726915.1 FtsH protease modulator YccA [Rosenbergiella australiborealis]